MQENEQENGRIEAITSLVEDGALFECSGYARVKVTRSGEEKILRLPIKSTGVQEFMDQLAELAPQPPVISKMIEKDSEMGRSLGLAADGPVQMFDLTDEAYIEKLRRHNQDFIWRVVIFALAMDFKNKDGVAVEDFEAKKKVLESNGITWEQANQIYADVGKLTRFAEEREDFLSAGASA